jgi:hypothetical protein
VRHDGKREAGARLLIDSAREPLIAALENPAEKPAPVVSLRSTPAGRGINMSAS